MGVLDNLYDRAGSAEVSGAKGSYIMPGSYIMRFEKHIAKISQKSGQPITITEFTVLAVTDDPWEEANRVGERVAWHNKPSRQSFDRNMKSLIIAITGMGCEGDTLVGDDGQRITVRDALIKASEGDGTLFAGAVVSVTAKTVKTKAGADFTAVYLDPVQPWQLEEYGLD